MPVSRRPLPIVPLVLAASTLLAGGTWFLSSSSPEAPLEAPGEGEAPASGALRGVTAQAPRSPSPSPQRVEEEDALPASAKERLEASDRSSDPLEAAREISRDMGEYLKTEDRDGQWAGEMRQRFDGYFLPDRLPGVTLASSDCRATLCKLEVDLTDENAKESFDATMSALIDPEGEAFVHVEGEDDRHIEVYLARGGHTLPS